MESIFGTGASDDHLSHTSAEFGTKGITQDGSLILKKLKLEENVKVAVTLISDSGESAGAHIFEGQKNPYKCEICNKIFKNNGALHTHMKAHEESSRSKKNTDGYGGQFKCEACGRFFKNKGAFHTHLKTHKQNSTKSIITNGSDIEVREKRSNYIEKSSNVGSGDEGLKESSDEGSMLSLNQDPACDVVIDKNVLSTTIRSHRKNDSGSKDNGKQGDEVKVNFEGDRNSETDLRSLRKHEKFVCKFCGKEFESRGGLLVHHQVHEEEEKLLKCQFCDNVYVTKGALEKHLKSHKLLQDSLFHQNKGSNYKCALCNQFFRLKGYLGKHIKRCHPGHSLKMNDNLLKDQKIAEDNHDSFLSINANSNQCKICSKTFQYKSVLLRHMVSHSKVCDEVFEQETELQNHSIPQYRKKPYKCNLCGKSFERNDTFSSHVLLHRPNKVSNMTKSHQCKICTKSFTKSYILKYHIASHNKGGSFKCSICNKIFKFKFSFRLHMETHKAKPYKCSVCGWRLRHKESFDRHKMIHEERCFKCLVCNEAFIKQMHLTKHIKLHSKQGVHKELKKTPLKANLDDSNVLAICTVCNKVFANRKSLISHMRMHRGEKYKCDFCSKSFNRMYTLKSHLKIIHKKALVNCKQGLEGELIKLNFSNQILFKCPVCGFVFIHHKELMGHMRIHTGQKPYECSTCHATFSGRHHLQEHINTKHPEVVRPKKKDACHTCVICSKAFIKHCDLKRHLRVHQKHGHVIPSSLLK